MRTTVDVPDPVYRRLKAEAALRGMTMKSLILAALEREIRDPVPVEADEPFPVIPSDRPGSLHLDPDQLDPDQLDTAQLARQLDMGDADGPA